MSAADYRRLARWARLAALLTYVALLLAIAAATLLWPGGGRQPSAVIWLLLSAPLLMFARGLYRGDVRTHAWLCFVSLLYFAIAVTNLLAPAGRLLDVVEVAATTGLFTAATLYVRWRSRALAGDPS